MNQKLASSRGARPVRNSMAAWMPSSVTRKDTSAWKSLSALRATSRFPSWRSSASFQKASPTRERCHPGPTTRLGRELAEITSPRQSIWGPSPVRRRV